MAREVFYTQKFSRENGDEELTATMQYDEARFGIAEPDVSPWNIAVQVGERDCGRIVGFEGTGRIILAMHQLKADAAARRGCEITVFRMADVLLDGGAGAPAAAVFSAFERWLLKHQWRGNIVKKLKFTAENQVHPIRRFWLAQGFELVPFSEGAGGWDEHVVKRWR
jgi:hypothetical protein